MKCTNFGYLSRGVLSLFGRRKLDMSRACSSIIRLECYPLGYILISFNKKVWIVVIITSRYYDEPEY